MVVFPPFSIADEPAHFLRIYALSEGEVVPVSRDGHRGVDVPSSLLTLLSACGQDAAGHPIGPGRGPLRGAFAIPLDPDQRAFASVPTSVAFPALRYLPQAAAVAVGRVCGLGPLALFYLARVAGLFFAAGVLTVALLLLPSSRWLLAAIAVGPLALSCCAAASAEGCTIGSAWLLAALTAAAFGGDARRAVRYGATLAAVVLCLAKVPYAAFSLPVLWARGTQRWRAIHLGLCAAAVLWSLAAAHGNEPLRPGADLPAQFAALRAAPVGVLQIILQDLAKHGPRYAAQLAGIQLGWLDTRLPWAFIWLTFLCWAVLWLGEQERPAGLDGRRRGLLLAGVVATVLLVFLSQFLSWSLPGTGVEGVQGRYFLPMVPFAALACGPPKLSWSLAPPWRTAIVLALFATGTACMVVAAARQFSR